MDRKERSGEKRTENRGDRRSACLKSRRARRKEGLFSFSFVRARGGEGGGGEENSRRERRENRWSSLSEVIGGIDKGDKPLFNVR